MQKKKLFIIISIILVLAAAAGIIYFIFSDRGYKTAVLKSDFDINTKVTSDFIISNGELVTANDIGVLGLNGKGESNWEVKVPFNNPVIKSSGRYFVVGDIEGKAVLLFKDNKLQWQSDFEYKVRSVDVNSSGIVTVVHGDNQYKAVVSVLEAEGGVDGKGKIRFSKSINESYVMNAIAAPSSTTAFINSVNTDAGKTKSIFSFVNLNAGETFSSIEIDDNMFPIVYINKDDILIAANNTSIMTFSNIKKSDKISDGKKIIWEKKEDNAYLLSAELCQNESIAAAFGSGNSGIFSTTGQTQIKIFSVNGEEKASFDVKGTVRRIDSGDNIIAISTDNDVFFYSMAGELMYEYNAPANISKVLFYNKREAVVVTKKNVNVIKAENKNDNASETKGGN